MGKIGDNIRKAREKNDLSQQEIAKLLDEKRSTYAEWEKDTIPKADVLFKISKILKVSYEELLGEGIDYLTANVLNKTVQDLRTRIDALQVYLLRYVVKAGRGSHEQVLVEMRKILEEVRSGESNPDIPND